MKKRPVLFAMLLIIAMLAVACSANGGNNTPPDDGINDDTGFGLDNGLGGELTDVPEDLPDTGGADLQGTEPASTAMVETQPAMTEPVATVVEATPITNPPEGDQLDSTPAPEEEADTGDQAGQASQLPLSDSAQVIPADDPLEVNRLSTLLGYQVADRSGNPIGMANDYIINLCEAHLLYLVVETANGQILVPYEAVSIGSGVVDAQQRIITLQLDAAQLSDAPVVDARLDMTTAEWENDVRSYWSNLMSLSNLTTGCRVAAVETITAGEGGEAGAETETPEATPAAGEDEAGQTPDTTTVTKIAYASNLLSAPLQDGNGNPLGQVQDAYVIPETGRVRYLSVELDSSTGGGPGLAPVPVRALNVTHESPNAATLVLLVEPDVLANAPTFDDVPDPNNENWRDEALQYWGQYVPLEEEPDGAEPVGTEPVETEPVGTDAQP